MSDEKILQIRMFGDFSLTYDGTTISDQHTRSGKLWTVLEYLITYREKEVTQSEIIELLWPGEDDVAAPANTLKTLLHRVRTQVGKLGDGELRNAITYSRGSYRWEPSMPCTIDVEEFDKLCKLALGEDDTSRKLEHLLSAIELYRGDFLPCSALDSWVIPIHAYYRNLYLKIVYEALALLTQESNYQKALELCQQATVVDPYDEELHLCTIRCLMSSGSQRAALQHYKHVTDLFYKHFGVSPSEELTAVYREVIHSDRDMELDLSTIKEDLQERKPDNYAFYCEYEFFKEFYHLEARSAARTGRIMHIALITANSNHQEDLTQKQLNATMERIQNIIKVKLRRSDIFTRYSLRQYLMLLPSANFENSQMVMERIITAFQKQYPKMPVTFEFKILPLDPLPL